MSARVEEGLYIGNRHAAEQKQTLLDLGITHVLAVGSELRCEHTDAFVYLQLPVGDSEQDIVQYVSMCNAFVETGRRKKGVFVYGGDLSRSASFVIAYLMFEHGWEYERAKCFLREKHPFAIPKGGLERQLQCKRFS
jgi:protein-tyrosine phosphatase